MKFSIMPKRQRAFTVLELLVLLVTLAVLAGLLLPALAPNKHHSGPNCVNNLKQIGLSFRIWASDNLDRYPMEVSIHDGGTRGFLAGTNVFEHFRAMSNELNTPKVLICPGDKRRTAATNFLWDLDNSHLGYFLGVDADQTNVTMLLSGDRHITPGTPLGHGVLAFTANPKVRWTKELHNGKGNVLLADGSVLQPTTAELRGVLANTGVATNRLAFP
jgi:prepilin-type processing-associated H-X9-DG protein